MDYLTMDQRREQLEKDERMNHDDDIEVQMQEPPKLKDPATCVHLQFNAWVDVGRIKSSDDQPDDAPVSNYNASVKICCADCEKPFRFIGLPCGLDLEGAAVSVDGREARLRILPFDQVLTPLEGLTGFTVRKTEGLAKYASLVTASIESLLTENEELKQQIADLKSGQEPLGW